MARRVHLSGVSTPVEALVARKCKRFAMAWFVYAIGARGLRERAEPSRDPVRIGFDDRAAALLWGGTSEDHPLRFLAILSPVKFEGNAIMDVFQKEPWRDLKAPSIKGSAMSSMRTATARRGAKVFASTVLLAFCVASLALGQRAPENPEALAAEREGVAIWQRNPKAPEPRLDEGDWPAPGTRTVWLRFGLRDEVPASWSGSCRAVGARIVRLRPWRFSPDMSIGEGASWSCASWWGPAPDSRPFDVHLRTRDWPFLRPGLLIDFEPYSTTEAMLDIKTDQGEFSIDLHALERGGTIAYLDGGVSATRAIFGEPVGLGQQPEIGDATGPLWHDYPSIALSPSGSADLWVAYQTYSMRMGGDRLMVRRRRGGRWRRPQPVGPGGRDYYRTALQFDARGDLWLIAAEQVGGNWDLYGWRRTDADWRGPVRLTRAPEPDLHHRLVRTEQGDLWLVWQGFRAGKSFIFARRWDGETWGPEIRVSDSPANDWEPAATALEGGGIAIAWDSYHHGNYDVFCRRLTPSAGEPQGVAFGPIVQVTGGPGLEARASIAQDGAGKLWIAYDTAGAHWGKDTGFWLELKKLAQGTRLYEGRGIGVSIVDQEGKVGRPPEAQLNFPMGQGLNEAFEYAELATDEAGRMWMFFRRKMDMMLMKRGIGWKFHRELYATRYEPRSGRWGEPRLAADSIGRQSSRVSVAVGRGRLWAAWATDHRSIQGERPDAMSVFAGSIALGTPAGGEIARASLAPVPIAPPEPDPAHPNGPADVARIRDYTIATGGKTYRIYRGDMHRHSETSHDGGGEGSLIDLYRYSLDAAAMDFVLVSDHNDGRREYDWWRREKSNDLFQIGESFVGLFGYERSAPFPNGHRNVFFVRRGVRPLPPVEGERRRGRREPLVNSGDVLYPYLRRYGGIAFSHTSATGMGTDWRDSDIELEPLVEIFQGDRTNYESLGAPWAADREDRSTQEGGLRQAGYVDRALRMGIKLGFQASSDHLSTHLSYSCIIAERNTREALMDAMKRRHAYGATDNIIMDVRSRGTDGPKIMGDIFTSPGAPEIQVRVIGTGKLHRIVVVKNDRIVYSTEPEGSEAEFRFVDTQAEAGKESYYYVRAEQEDERLAWASPMWITPGE